jgi:hypothetical protein
MKIWILALLSGVLFLGACDNTLDINAPYRETPVVYAVLDLGQDSQIFRIQKTYQNDISKTTDEVAQIADSLYMKNITVKVTNFNNPNLFRDFVRVSPRKESGFFSNLDSSYWGQNTVRFFNAGARYTLRIKSNETGNEYIATTTAVGKANINFGSELRFELESAPTFSFGVLSTTTAPDLGPGLGVNVFVSDAIVRLNYLEVDKATNESNQRYVDYYVRRDLLTSTTQGGRFTTSVSKKGLLDFYKANISLNANFERTFQSIEFVIIGSNSDYYDMIQTNKPSGSIIPKVTDYSNITNGIGVFASRTTTKLRQSVSAASVDLINTQVLNRP